MSLPRSTVVPRESQRLSEVGADLRDGDRGGAGCWSMERTSAHRRSTLGETRLSSLSASVITDSSESRHQREDVSGFSNSSLSPARADQSDR